MHQLALLSAQLVMPRPIAAVEELLKLNQPRWSERNVIWRARLAGRDGPPRFDRLDKILKRAFGVKNEGGPVWRTPWNSVAD